MQPRTPWRNRRARMACAPGVSSERAGLRMMRRLCVRLSSAVAVAVAVAGCVSTPYARLRDYKGSDAGRIVASVGLVASSPMQFSMVEFRKKDSGDRGVLQFSPGMVDAFSGDGLVELVDARGSSVLVQRWLPPGEYEIVGYASGTSDGKSLTWYAGQSDLALPFSVRPGEVTYLGRFLVGVNRVPAGGTVGATPVALGTPVSSYLEIRSQPHLDMSRLKGSPVVHDEAVNLLGGEPSGVLRLN